MKVYVNGKTHDAANEIVVLVFENDLERNRIINSLSNMDNKEGKRAFAEYPNDKHESTEVLDLMKSLTGQK